MAKKYVYKRPPHLGDRPESKISDFLCTQVKQQEEYTEEDLLRQKAKAIALRNLKGKDHA